MNYEDKTDNQLEQLSKENIKELDKLSYGSAAFIQRRQNQQLISDEQCLREILGVTE